MAPKADTVKQIELLDDYGLGIEKLKVNRSYDTRDWIRITMLVLGPPTFELFFKSAILSLFSQFVIIVHPLAQQGLFGILGFAAIVAICDGIILLPVRYAEFLTALCFRTSNAEYFAVMLIGKTVGGFITYKSYNFLLGTDGSRDLIASLTLNVGLCGYYLDAITDLVRERPIFFGLLFRMFFPSNMSSVMLAILPTINQAQFVFIQFLQALILSMPETQLDFNVQIDKRFPDNITSMT